MAAGNAGSTDDKNQNSASQAPKGSGGGGLITTILSVVNLLATVGILAILALTLQKDKHPAVEDIAPHATEAEKHSEEKDDKHASGGEHGGGGGEHGGGHGGGEKKKNSSFARMINLDQFTVNLSNPGSATPKFARANISLEVPTEDTETEVTSKMPQIRNTIIDLFNSKRPSDLATSDGRDYLKEEIRNALNSFLVSGKVKGVYFTSFAVAG
jgi:flagellar basal body-associated protein FliL